MTGVQTCALPICFPVTIGTKEVVESARNEAEFELEVIFIDGDAELEKLYGEEVPVTMINGKRHDYFRVDRTRFIEAVLHPHQ